MRFILVIDKSTHGLLEQLATREERSMAATVRYLIKQEAAKKLAQTERKKNEFSTVKQ